MQKRKQPGFSEQKEAAQVLDGLQIDQQVLSKAIRRQLVDNNILTDREQYMLLLSQA
jgi:hypothetical protein